jgi:hypothetical protein
MEQMKIDEAAQLKIDMDSENIPASVKEFRPVVFKEGNAYCCILGPDPQTGVFGCGQSPAEAMQDWDRHLKDLIEKRPEGNPVAEYVTDTLAASKNRVW